MISYWVDHTKDEGKFKTLEQDISCDVCIVGAGLFGLTTAYYLSKKGLNVIVIDKSDIGTKTSGYTTAKITSQHGLIYEYLINSFSQDFAKKYLNANQDAIKNIKNIIDTENIDCDFTFQNSFVYTTKPEETDKIKKEIDAVNSLGFNAKFITETSLPFDIAGSIMFPNQAQFHPRKYMLGLCNCIVSNNGNIFTNTTATNVKKENDAYFTYTTNHKIKSKYVVLASHYPFINIPGFYFTKMYQTASYVIAIDLKSNNFNGMYITSSNPVYSYRAVKEGDRTLLLLGGMGHKTGETVSIHSTYSILEQEAKKYYPDCEILYRWNTEDCITLDKIPYIGEFSNLMPNMFIGTGFNKWGMTSSNVAANIVSDKILRITNKYEDIFSSTRMSPIKNRWEMKNIIKQTTNSLVVDKLKISSDTLEDIKRDSGTIIEENGRKIGIYKDTSGNIFAVKPICTHLGCLLNWNNVDKTWDCPCHGSRFNYMGKNLYDPAIKNLETYNL